MKLLHLSGLQDYLALAVRRKWWIIVPFFSLTGVVIVLTYALPKIYVSKAVILIRPRDVPDDFVKDLLAGTTEQRLTAIEQTVLSRKNLVAILQEFEENMTEYRGLNMDDKVLKLGSEIKIDFEMEKRSAAQPSITYFQISYQNRNRELAQKIAAKLTSLFIAQYDKAREDQVIGTTDFLSSELEKLSAEMKKSDENLKELRGRRRYELPEQLETNLRTLDRLSSEKQANAEAFDRADTIRLNLERLIYETEPVIPKPVTAPSIRAAVRSSLVEEYRKKNQELKELTAKFKPKHPDVEAATLQLERLKAELSPQDLAALEQPDDEKTETQIITPTMPNPFYQDLKSRLEQVKTELEIRERERKDIDSAIQKYNQRVQNTPQSEQEISEVLRQNTNLNKQYEALNGDLTEAKLSESLESRQRGSQFVILDEANLPLNAAKPSKTKIVLLGTLFSLLIGIGIAVVVDVLSQRIWTQSEIESIFGVFVLAEIPPIVTPGDLAAARRKRIFYAASSIAGAATYAVALYFVHVKQAYVLIKLDPLVQRLLQ